MPAGGFTTDDPTLRSIQLLDPLTSGLMTAETASAASCTAPGHNCHAVHVNVHDRVCPAGQYPSSRPTGVTAGFTSGSTRVGSYMVWSVGIDSYYGLRQKATFDQLCNQYVSGIGVLVKSSVARYAWINFDPNVGHYSIT